MIRVYSVEDTLDDEGGSTLIITGHASPLVCAGASAIWRTMLAGFALLAKNYPKQISYQATLKKKQSTRR